MSVLKPLLTKGIHERIECCEIFVFNHEPCKSNETLGGGHTSVVTEVVFGRKNESIFNSFCSLLSILRYFYISMLTVGEGGPLMLYVFYGNWHVHYFSYTLARLRQL